MKICFYSLSIFLASFFILSFTGCSERSTEANDLIPVKPVVKVSNVNYTRDSFYHLFPDSASLKNIGTAYSGNKYSEEVKKALNDYMRQQVRILGEDSKTFDRMISLSGCSITGEYVLPTYAEKAKYNGQDCWIFQITTGLGAPAFGHFKCFAFGLEKPDTLAYVGCK
ncbi:MAG TPA: hypothetical protein VHO03_21005 [Ignavibacteriales bacterium]|nr:hypothetical protein [Ignavibacteriales bacterium]